MKSVARDLCPPVLWRALSRLKSHTAERFTHPPTAQDLEVYWDPKMAALLETWGVGNVWDEIRLLLACSAGTALDIACGTGKTISIVQSAKLAVHGCDISDMLIRKAIERGLPNDRLRVCDATNLPYADKSFDYSYSIGSLEHFTEDGIGKVAGEAARVTRVASFHMMPVSRSGKDEGWLKTYQSFFNCSPDWWVARLRQGFSEVEVFDSHWNDSLSVGKWFVCRP
jgi:SAM-dependent methyltransferase